ncbi:hypothetical protein [Aquitalea aquatilis]|uniref:hypothetical protein n=1 Tax=Aquitalea aquatilis TaxID=1537400 RepID=UPI0010BD2D95|nr:hypothetical protein [Aquitalea aquatilis]
MLWLSSHWTRSGWAAFSLYPLLAFIGFKLGLPSFLHGVLPALLACGLIGWWLNYRRYRLIADTPTAHAASAALGHVELCGVARNHPLAANYSPYSGRRCVWYRCWRYHNDRRGLNGGSTLDPFERSNGLASLPENSELSFLLLDGKQEVIINPEGAEVIAPHRESWQEGNETLVEEWIAEGDPLYVLGQLQSHGGSRPDQHSFRQDVGAKLAEWKQDQPALLRRHDLDGDGKISEQEWLLVRAAAEREVRQNYQQLASTPPTLHIGKPDDGKPYLINTLPPRQVARSYRLRAWLHALAALLSFIAWLYSGLSA